MDALASSFSIAAPVAGEFSSLRERWRLAMCTALVALGSGVLVAWFSGIEPLKSIAPGLSTMKVNTALAFVLTGSALAIGGYHNPPAKALATALAALVAFIGLATLAEYAWGIDLGIDEALVPDAGTLRGSGHPGRMSPLTAAAWVALGVAIILLALARKRRPILVAHALGSSAAVAAVFSAAGYTFGAEAFRGIGSYAYIAVHTIVGLLIAAAAVLLTKAHEGWLQPYVGSPAARDLLVRLLPLSISAPLLLGLLLLLGAGLGAYNAAYAFALFIPATSIAMALIALWVAARQREGEVVRLRYEKHLGIVAAELNHRVKNTLAIVQSLAHQSWSGQRSGKAAKSAFDARLTALAAAHDLLTRQNWEQVSIRDLAHSTLSPLALCGKRITVDGPPVMLGPKASITLVMTLHELATNAVKYGALSDPGGRVEIGWSRDNGRLRLTWLERGGPACTPPQQEGFGTRMLRRALAAELGGSASLCFDADGLWYEFEAPLAAIEPSSQAINDRSR